MRFLFVVIYSLPFFSFSQKGILNVSIQVNPIHVFFDGTPIFDIGFNTDIHLRSLQFFDDRFKESRTISLSKNFGKNKLQLSYSTYGNAVYFENPEMVDYPITSIRKFRDFDLNYFRNYRNVFDDKVSLSFGVGFRYRHGTEWRDYGAFETQSGFKESIMIRYKLKDAGINMLHQVDYNFSRSFNLFLQFNFLSTLIQGDKESKDFFDNQVSFEDYRPQRFNFSLGLGLTYSFIKK